MDKLLFYVLSALLLGTIIAITSGCSSRLEIENDMFFPTKHEPRSEMPWYSSVGGKSNTAGFRGMKGDQ